MKLTKILLITTIVAAIVSFTYYFFSYVYIPQAKSKGCAPLNFKSAKQESSYYLTWETQMDCSQYIKYGLKDNSFPYLAIDINGASKLKEHKILMSGVDTGVNYYVVIVDGDKTYGKEGLPLEVKFD
ncbi:hypothetical protein M0R04_02225 [Candidatus Dojkabacteria bacterium]|jgi:hypothetical protein|nr:hypothetical protein [Candidatus Dojkabacteria bacterium]